MQKEGQRVHTAAVLSISFPSPLPPSASISLSLSRALILSRSPSSLLFSLRVCFLLLKFCLSECTACVFVCVSLFLTYTQFGADIIMSVHFVPCVPTFLYE